MSEVDGVTGVRQRWSQQVRRRVACGFLAVVAGAVPVAVASAPAGAAAGGSLYLNGINANAAAGSTMAFTAALVNLGPEQVNHLRLVLGVSAAGANIRLVNVERLGPDGNWQDIANRSGNQGDVQFVDDSFENQSMVNGGALAGIYRLTFRAGTPPGPAIVMASAQHRTTGGWQLLASSPQYLTNIALAAEASGNPASPAATIGVQVAPAAVGGSSVTARSRAAVAGGASGGSRRSTMIGIGAVLVLLVAAALLLRSQVVGGTESLK